MNYAAKLFPGAEIRTDSTSAIRKFVGHQGCTVTHVKAHTNLDEGNKKADELAYEMAELRSIEAWPGQLTGYSPRNSRVYHKLWFITKFRVLSSPLLMKSLAVFIQFFCLFIIKRVVLSKKVFKIVKLFACSKDVRVRSSVRTKIRLCCICCRSRYIFFKKVDPTLPLCHSTYTLPVHPHFYSRAGSPEGTLVVLSHQF